MHLNKLRKGLFKLVLLWLIFPSQSIANAITAIRLNSSQSQPRIVLAFSGKPSFKLLKLSNPARLVIDLKNTKLRTSLKKLKLNGQFKTIRSGVRRGHNLRLVFQLKELPTRVDSAWLRGRSSGASRLVLDLDMAGSKKATTSSNAPSPRVYMRKIVIAIDPGHGGRDPGATSRRWGIHEKTVVLSIAKALQRRLNQEPGFKAVLTRKGDYYVGLRQRLRIARKLRPDLFISVHADAFANSRASGASIYALSARGASSEAARWLAAKENNSELVGGVDLADKGAMLRSVLIDMSQTATVNASLNIGRRLLTALSSVTRLHIRKVEQAGFVVLKSPDIPSILIETGFLSNAREAKKLANRRYQRSLTAALAKGIREYFIYHAPSGTWFSYRHQPINYRVARGDNLSTLADRFDVSVNTLMRHNSLRNTRLRIGQKIVIPAVAS